jgi:hypothetical protein
MIYQERLNEFESIFQVDFPKKLNYFFAKNKRSIIKTPNMTSLNRADRLFMESQIRQLDSIQRVIIDMRSTLARRMRRFNTLPARNVRRTAPRIQPINLVDEFESAMIDVEEEQPVVAVPVERHDDGVQEVRQVRRVPPPVRIIRIKHPKLKEKVVKQTELNVTLENLCGICLDEHVKKDSLLCNCNHEFGKDCFNQWLDICKASNQVVTCPTCRIAVKEIIGFRARAPKRLATAADADAVMDARNAEGI